MNDGVAQRGEELESGLFHGGFGKRLGQVRNPRRNSYTFSDHFFRVLDSNLAGNQSWKESVSNRG
jgi:hypothetical protein